MTALGGLNYSYLTLSIAFASFLLGFIVLSADYKSVRNRWFFVFTISIVFWLADIYYFQQYSQSIIILRAQYAFGGLVLVLSYPWLMLLDRDDLSRIGKIMIGITSVIITLIPFMGNLLIGNIIFTDTGYTFTQGPLFNLYSIALFLLIALNFYLNVRRAANNTKEKRVQSIYLVIGIGLFAIVAIVVNVVLPIMKINIVAPYDAQASIFWVSLTAYAVTRQKLFDIRVVAAETFVVFLLILTSFRLVTAQRTSDLLIDGSILVASCFIGFFLVKSIRQEVTRREEVEKLAKEKTETLTELEERNKNLATLQTISKLVLNEIEMKPMVQKILNEIPKRLEQSAGALLTLVKEGQLQTYAMSETDITEKIKGLIGKSIDQFSYPIKKDFNKLHEALFTKDIVESSHMSDFISPPIQKPVATTIQTLLGVHSIIAIPLFSGDTPLGVLMLTFKVERDHLKNKDMEMIWAVADDVSLAVQRAESYQKLKDANDYLSQLDKMKDEFISMASHELNTPLAAVEGYLSMILDEHMGKVDDKAREYLGRAYDSSKRLAELILDLLNVSRIEQGRVKMKFSQANLYDLAESVVHELQVKSDAKKLSLTLDGKKSDKLNTWCDPDRIREVIVNMVGNSIKYTEKGGITIKVEEDNGKIIVKIIDTGRGIAQEDMNKLFQKFSQVKREIDEHQGTGLGLYISRNFVELHKGRIWVESEVGKGSTFAFEIPVLKEAPKEVQGAILENVAAPKIESGVKDTPAIIAQSAKGNV